MVFHDHDVQLYEAVGRDMLARALRAGDRVVVVATPAHRAGLDAAVREAGVDLVAARSAGRYLEADAAELLASVSGLDGLDIGKLEAMVAGLADETRRHGGRLHLFSEMVTLLWDDGLATVALELEELGNQLVDAHGIEFTCSYPTSAFPDGPATPGLVEICAGHGEQLWPSSVAGAASSAGTVPLPAADSQDGGHGQLLWAQLEMRDQMLDAVDASVIATDLDGRVLAWNDGARRLHGWTAEQAIGRDVVEMTVPASGRELGRQAWASVVATDCWEGRLEADRADGTTVPVRVRTRVLRGTDGAPTGVVGVAVGLSEQVERERALLRRDDWLRSVTELMGEGLARLDRDGRIVSVNPHGHQLLAARDTAVGGSFLNRLLPVRADGTVTELAEVLIGAEFDGWLPDEPTEARLLRGDGSTIPIEYVATRIPPDDGRPAGWVVVFRDIIDRLARDRQLRAEAGHATWMGRIRDALDHDRFVLHAQPIIDLHTGEVVQHELLIRLDDPDDGLISPGAFMPTAEAYGLAPNIDRWVITQAIQHAAAGRPVEVNLSARSFADPTLPHIIRQLLDETGADPSLLVFELTETAMLDNEDEAARFADHMRTLGCRLALDDFGTGYGAFLYLKRLPVDLLKIDIEFVRDALTNPASRHVIAAVVSLARSLDIHTIAEGVEDAATADLLAELGVDQAQGYHFGRPEPLQRS